MSLPLALESEYEDMNGFYRKIIAAFVITVLTGNLFSQADSTFKVGIIKYKTRKAVEQTYTPILNYLAESLGKEAEITIYENGEDLGYLLTKGRLDMGIFTPFPYLSTKIAFPELEVFASHTVNGQDSYSGCILVHKESNIDALHKLQGKHFTFVKETSTSGFKYPKGIFIENNLDIDHGFFREYDFSGGHNNSLQLLLDRKTDGIAIDDASYDELEEATINQLVCLARYEVPYHAYILNPELEGAERERIKTTMFQAHLNPDLRDHFQNNSLGLNRWHPQTDEAYNALRRYLRIVRVKPGLQFNIKLEESAKAVLAEEGDLVPIVQKNIINQLRKFNRFAKVGDGEVEHGKSARLEIGRNGKKYHCILYLEEEPIWEDYFSQTQIANRKFAENIALSIIGGMPIHTELHFNHRDHFWFITYGTDDGIDAEDYSFRMEGVKDELEINKINAINTVFVEIDRFREGKDIKIAYHIPDRDGFFDFSEEMEDEEEGFWDNRDNVWGVVGLVVAFLTVAIGSYFAGRKKKRFKDILYGANDILRLHIEGNGDVQVRLMKKKEKINRSLEKGFINENQFLILMHRLDDIDYVINTYLVDKKELPAYVMDEIRQILSDGKITEREYSQMVSLIKTAARDQSK